MSEKTKNSHYTETVIERSSAWSLAGIFEIKDYWDLLCLLIRRDFVSKYKQTILGPAWAIIQPVLTSVVFTIIFGKVAKIPTDSAPPFLFFLTGMLFWQLFSSSMMTGGNSLQINANIFSKVYFPRIVQPIATQIGQLIPFVIQGSILLIFLVIYYTTNWSEIKFEAIRLLLFPLLLLQVSLFSLGACFIYSALTAKYRDFQHALGFLVQLGLYVTPVIYPASVIPERFSLFITMNPMASPISTLKWILLDTGSFNLMNLLVAWIITLITLLVGILLFQNVQKTFVDTV